MSTKLQAPTIYRSEFPFEEIRDTCGNYFSSVSDAEKLGYDKSHLWSVIACGDEDDEGKEFVAYSYGPTHHFVNLLGFIATSESHDGNTYYEENVYFD